MTALQKEALKRISTLLGDMRMDIYYLQHPEAAKLNKKNVDILSEMDKRRSEAENWVNSMIPERE